MSLSYSFDGPYSFDGHVARLAVRVTPRAAREDVAGVVETGDGKVALSVRLNAPPVEGAANRALIALLARKLGVPRSAVSIVSGEASRLKTVRLARVDPERLARLCGQ
jgi:uncharacterized protein (TIGR00251 family)